MVVINNRGGRIFDRLALKQTLDGSPALFKRCFSAPSHLNISAICGAFGLRHRRANVSEADGALSEILQQPGLSVMEVPLEDQPLTLPEGPKANPSGETENLRPIPMNRI